MFRVVIDRLDLTGLAPVRPTDQSKRSMTLRTIRPCLGYLRPRIGLGVTS